MAERSDDPRRADAYPLDRREVVARLLHERGDLLVVAGLGASAWDVTAAGDTVPLRVIRSAPFDEPVLGISNPGSVAYDSKREEILVPN